MRQVQESGGFSTKIILKDFSLNVSGESILHLIAAENGCEMNIGAAFYPMSPFGEAWTGSLHGSSVQDPFLHSVCLPREVYWKQFKWSFRAHFEICTEKLGTAFLIWEDEQRYHEQYEKRNQRCFLYLF